MTIITRKRTKNFAVIPNAIADDQRLSLEARGLLVYLLAKPDDWCVDVQNIRKIGKIGRDKAYKLLRELREAGYINIEEKRDGKGRVVEYEYLVHDSALIDTLPFGETLQQDEPLFQPVPDLPDTEKPDAVKPDADLPDTENPDARINNKNNNKNTSPPIPPLELTDFAKLWNLWPEKDLPQSMSAADSAFRKLSGENQALAVKHVATFIQRCQSLKTRPALITYVKEKQFLELDGAPPINKTGEFIITPDRPEWGEWEKNIKKRWGEKAVEQTRKLGWMIRKTRWPEKSKEKAA